MNRMQQRLLRTIVGLYALTLLEPVYGIDLIRRYEYYRINPQSAELIEESMVEASPIVINQRNDRHYAASYAYTIDFRNSVEYERDGRQCNVIVHHPKLEGVVKMPKLDRREIYSSEVMKAFDELNHSLTEHELEHERIVYVAYNNLRLELINHAPFNGCGEANQFVEMRLNAVEKQVAEANRAHDCNEYGHASGFSECRQPGMVAKESPYQCSGKLLKFHGESICIEDQ